nr:hypothetical protein [Bradyrhizobium sp. CCH5-A9]
MILADIITGAVNGAVQSVIPRVEADVVRTIRVAQEASPMAPAVAPPATLDADAIAGKVLDRVLSDPAVAKLTTPIPWYQSQAIWGGIIAAGAPIAGLFGYAISSEDQVALAQNVVVVSVGISSVVGGALAIYGRLTTTRAIKGA